MAKRPVTILMSALLAAPILLSLILACSAPKALLRSESRIDPLLDVSRTVHIVSPEAVAAAALDSSVFEQVMALWTTLGLRSEYYALAVDELASQLREQGLTLIDNPEDADLVFEFYLEESSSIMFRRAGGSYGSSAVRDFLFGPAPRRIHLCMLTWNLGNWVNPIERLKVWEQNVGNTLCLPDSLQPGWFAVLETPGGESLDFISRIDLYVGLLLSAYGKNITEEHSIRLGPRRKK